MIQEEDYKNRSESIESRKDLNSCIACKCEHCRKMRKSAKEINIQLCGYELDEEILVN